MGPRLLVSGWVVNLEVLRPNLMWLRISMQRWKDKRRRTRAADSINKKMKVGSGLVYGGPRATALPSVLLRHSRAGPRCSYSSDTPGNLGLCLALNFGSAYWYNCFKRFVNWLWWKLQFTDHVSFIKEVAATQPPQHLSQLLTMLKTKGGSLLKPLFKIHISIFKNVSLLGIIQFSCFGICMCWLFRENNVTM